MCFSLLYSEGKFQLSRNFNLQKVGDLQWILDNYDFESICRSIDELIVLNVGDDPIDSPAFLADLHSVIQYCFMPVAVGGGVRTIEQARLLFANGADKVVLNSEVQRNPVLIAKLAAIYGSQSILASIDFRRSVDGVAEVYIDGGKTSVGYGITDAVSAAAAAGVGEIYLTSIDRDGTGTGYDFAAIEEAYNSCNLPIIAAGGADTAEQLAAGIRSGLVSAVATSHLFNFMCDGLHYAREEMIDGGVNLSRWNFEGIK
jgi:cyclase